MFALWYLQRIRWNQQQQTSALAVLGGLAGLVADTSVGCGTEEASGAFAAIWTSVVVGFGVIGFGVLAAIGVMGFAKGRAAGLNWTLGELQQHKLTAQIATYGIEKLSLATALGTTGLLITNGLLGMALGLTAAGLGTRGLGVSLTSL